MKPAYRRWQKCKSLKLDFSAENLPAGLPSVYTDVAERILYPMVAACIYRWSASSSDRIIIFSIARVMLYVAGAISAVWVRVSVSYDWWLRCGWQNLYP